MIELKLTVSLKQLRAITAVLSEEFTTLIEPVIPAVVHEGGIDINGPGQAAAHRPFRGLAGREAGPARRRFHGRVPHALHQKDFK